MTRAEVGHSKFHPPVIGHTSRRRFAAEILCHDFDIDLAYEAMYKSATTPGKDNLMRPDNDDYMNKGYVPLKEQFNNSVSHALEYYIADYSLYT